MTLSIVLEFNFKESKEYVSPSKVLTREISGTRSICRLMQQEICF